MESPGLNRGHLPVAELLPAYELLDYIKQRGNRNMIVVPAEGVPGPGSLSAFP